MKRPVTYKKAGVDITRADGLIRDMKRLIDTTRVRGSMDSIGGFGGFFDPVPAGGKEALLVASTDGVGTKLKIAQIAGKHDTVGIDLVAMCVNDVLCSGARPLFFLDYFACGKLESKIWKDVLKGIIKGCRDAECALLGGETAEMPGMYKKGEYDLAGFSVGAVSRKNVIDGKKIRPGDVLLGIASSGLHSNGFSLVRKVLSRSEMKRKHKELLTPTFIYVRPFFAMAGAVKIKGAANITGGGFYDNIPRMLPPGLKARVRKGTWVIPEVFNALAARTRLSDKELYRTFNMGIGMVMALSAADAERAKNMLARKFKLKSWIIGEVAKGKRCTELV
jgi:phosphoribosylformylglycinamidine cyclo-ligase